MQHKTVKVLLDDSYSYSDFSEWFNSLDSFEKETWIQIAKHQNQSEDNIELLTKKAMELYCIEMDIDYIPNNEEYLETIYRKFVVNIILSSMKDRGLINLNNEKLSLLSDSKFEFTEKGKSYMK